MDYESMIRVLKRRYQLRERSVEGREKPWAATAITQFRDNRGLDCSGSRE